MQKVEKTETAKVERERPQMFPNPVMYLKTRKSPRVN
jgi:hypothetical protein